MLKQFQKPLIILFAVFIFINLISIDFVLFNQYTNKQNPTEKITSPVESNQKNEEKCTNCISATPTISLSPTPTIKPISSTSKTQSTSSVKEFMIALGSGTNQSTEWVDVPGVGATINSNDYGSIKNIYFEVSLIMPTTNNLVSIRLYNVTDQHPVWYSQIDSNGQNTAFLSSQAIKLDSGNKLYQVQMKSLLTDQPVTLVQSRIHITVN